MAHLASDGARTTMSLTIPVAPGVLVQGTAIARVGNLYTVLATFSGAGDGAVYATQFDCVHAR